MITGDKVLGVIATYNTQEYAYGEDDLQVLSLMASQAAIALDNARLLQGVKWAQQLAALQEIGITITSQLELREVLGLITENANEISSADFCTLFPYDSERDAFEGGIRKGKVDVEPSIPSNAGLAAHIAKTQEAVFAEDAEKQPGVKPTFIRDKRVKSFAGVPLVIGGTTVGVLYVNFFEPHSFSGEEQETIRLLANQAAVAIENARLYEQLRIDLSTTEEQQEALRSLLGVNQIAGRFVHRISQLAGTVPVDIQFIQDKIDPRSPSYKEVYEDLEEIRIQMQQMLHMVQRIRDSALKLEASQHLQQVEASKLMDRALAEIRGGERVPSWGRKISVVQDHRDQHLIIETFELLFVEALGNLISNAVEAMPQGGTLTLRTERRVTADAEYAVLTVADTGGGIPAEDLKRIFSMGYSSKPHGFGYGLWLVKQICDATGARIAVDSEEGVRSTFELKVPLAG